MVDEFIKYPHGMVVLKIISLNVRDCWIGSHNRGLRELEQWSRAKVGIVLLQD